MNYRSLLIKRKEKRDKMTKMLNCKNDGLCCLVHDEDGKWHDCPNLYRRLDGETRCLIYDTRLNKRIGPKQKCTLRAFSPYDYPNCPFNTGKPIHPAYRD